MNTMKKQVKGFTLIELIVVMAIFGTILASAMALIQPSSKVLSNTQNQENGNAAVSNISSYLENELSSVEYLSVINDASATPNTSYIEEYIKSYYEGVLKAGATVDDRKYAEGDIHMLVIGNQPEGFPNTLIDTYGSQIVRYTYHVSFKPGDFKIDLKDTQVFNKAYFDDYYLTFRAGLFADPSEFAGTPETYETLLNNITSQNTQFTIQSTRRNIECPKCHTPLGYFASQSYGNETIACPNCMNVVTGEVTKYSFLSNASMSLVNIYNRSTSGVTGRYFVVNETVLDKAGEEPSIEKSIVDITNPALTKKGATQEVTHLDGSTEEVTLNSDRQYGYVMMGTKVYYAGENPNGYTFIYSYGSEINTN